METMEPKEALLDEYPAEVTFKSIFRCGFDPSCGINSILDESGLKGIMSDKTSRNGIFISYTITVTFQSHAEMAQICSKISLLNGFMTML